MIHSITNVEPIAVCVLIGAPAAGKTRTGKRVARLLGVPFIDTDKMIVAQHGAISQIFAEHGEGHFRLLEREAVSEALHTRAVVSLGGGAVLHPDTRTELEGLPVIQLTTTADAVATRIGDGKRPLLSEGTAAWEALVARRQPIYDSLASVTFSTANVPLDSVAEAIADWLRSS